MKRLFLCIFITATSSICAPQKFRSQRLSGNLVDELNAMIRLLPDDAWTERCVLARLIKAQATPQELLNKWDQFDCGNLSTYRYLTSLSKKQ